MIMSEEKVMEALKICASHDKSRCVECPYNGWCGDTVNPHMNMQKDALEIITRQKNLLYAADLAFREIYKQLGKANLDLERYGRRIREQKEEILDLLAKLDGAIAGHGTPPETCTSCGDVIPEGRQVCPTCENAKGEAK